MFIASRLHVYSYEFSISAKISVFIKLMQSVLFLSYIAVRFMWDLCMCSKQTISLPLFEVRLMS